MPGDLQIFTFDPGPFVKGLHKVVQGMGGLTKSAGNMAKNVSAGVVNAVKKIGLLTLAFKGVQSAIREMPEIGKTFEIAKGIIMKNLLFPLRKAVFPLLQKFLNWVRDNRAMFLKWGQTLVNIFNTVVSAVEKVIDIGNRLMKTFAGFIGRVFGAEIRSFQELLNILSFKFAVVIEFISSLLGKVSNVIGPVIQVIIDNVGKILDPISRIAGHIVDIVGGLFDMNENGNSLVTIFTDIVNTIGNIATFAAEIVESFVKGLKPHLSGVVDSIGKMAKSFKSIFNSIFGADEKLDGWKALFELIGQVVGVTLVDAFQKIEVYMESIASSLRLIDDIINLLTGKDISEDLGKNIKGYLEGIANLVTFGGFGTVKNIVTPVDDAIIKPDGSIIQTAPEDYLIATKTPGNLVNNETTENAGKVMINIDFTGMQIIVQEGTREEAARFSESLVSQFRTVLTAEMERNGVK